MHRRNQFCAGCVSVDAVLTPQLRDPSTLARQPLHKSTQPHNHNHNSQEETSQECSMAASSHVSHFGDGDPTHPTRFIWQNKEDLIRRLQIEAGAVTWCISDELVSWQPGFNPLFHRLGLTLFRLHGPGCQAEPGQPGCLPLNSLQKRSLLKCTVWCHVAKLVIATWQDSRLQTQESRRSNEQGKE